MSEKSLKKPKKRTILSIAFIFLLMPLCLVTIWKIGGKSYYLGSVIMILGSMIPFFVNFEEKHPGARELVIIAVLSAIAMASRVALAAIPFFSPIVALIIIPGLALGPEVGFLVGTISAFASNFVFGQGPWTPWQMFAYGMAGYIAGIFANAGIVNGMQRIKVSIFGGLLAFILVGPLLDTASAFLMINKANAAGILAVYTSGIPVNAILAASTVFTLVLFSKPMTEKLDRIKVKYGLNV